MTGDMAVLRKELDELWDKKEKLALLLEQIAALVRATDDSIRQIATS